MTTWRMALIWCLAGAVVLQAGCATLIRGTVQGVRIQTHPPGGRVFVNGRAVDDGEALSIRTRFEPTRVNIGRRDRPVYHELSYSPDPLLIADGVLLFAFVIPGVGALVVDFATGAWRQYDEVQHLYPESAAE